MVVVHPLKSYKGFAVTSWILFVVTCLVAIVPVIGFATWLVAFAVIPLIIVFAIIILTRGGTVQGIMLIIAAVLVMPAFLLIAPLASTLLLGGSIVAVENTQEKQIMENLRNIAAAKAQSGAAAGSIVSMADLTQYLPGKTIKAVVGESYDPQPIGQAPTAMLPTGKSLGSHKAGEVITADSTASPETPNSPAATGDSPIGASTPEPSPSTEESTPEPSASSGFHEGG